MTCYTGFGNLADGRPFWKGDLNGDGKNEILFHYPGDHNWWLGTFNNGVLSWSLVGNTAGFGNVADGRPIWVADFNGDQKAEILFYYPGDHNWWLGSINNGALNWTLAGNTGGFGQIGDGRPIWIGDFSGDGKADILFYYPGDRNWWLGVFNGSTLSWKLAGNTSGFGNLGDGRPIWIGNFQGGSKAQVLFYYPGDHNWWLGSINNGALNWTLSGNTGGFGQIGDGRPIWIGDFSGDGKADVLFYYPGDHNWWLGVFQGNTLSWKLAGNTAGFGNVGDGRPIWIGNFSVTNRAEVLFYYPGDHNWWLGSMNNGSLGWSLIGNTGGFGQVWDGRPFWIGDFTGDGKSDVLFYFPGDGNWWLGSMQGSALNWNFSGNTGRPGSRSITVHFKSLLPLDNARSSYLNDQYALMEALFAGGGNIAVFRGGTEDLSSNTALTALQNLDVGSCTRGNPTADQNSLFQNRNNVSASEIVVYLVNTLIGGAGNFVGCATHPAGQPGCAIVQTDAPWLTAHEVGHVLGLTHVSDTKRLMNPDTGWTDLPPDLDSSEFQTMLKSALTTNC